MKKVMFLSSLAIAFALGGTGMWAWQQHATEEQGPMAAADMPAGNDLLPPLNAALPDPMLEMQRMHRQMEQLCSRNDVFNPGAFSGNFGSWMNTGAGGFGVKIQEDEDDDSVFLKLKVGDKDVSDVNVSVADGYVSIDAEVTDKTDNSYAHSSVSQSFPVPAGVDPDSARITQEDGSIVIRFDKLA